MITGVTLIRNGNLLRYPWKLCIKSLLATCDRVIVNCSPTDDNTFEELKMISQYHPVQIVESNWDMSNTGNGSMLALEANKAISEVKSGWIMYLQADELVHEDDAEYYKNITNTAPANIGQIEMYRSYFWKSLQQRYKNNELWLGRLFRVGTNIVGGDGMHLVRLSGDVYRANKLIYHYSRMGSEKQITNRVRNLDRLFHDKEKVNQMKDFSYIEATQSDIIYYDGSHPAGVKEFYNE